MEGLFDVDVDENGPFIVSYIPEREEMDTHPINSIEKQIEVTMRLQIIKSGVIPKTLEAKLAVTIVTAD